MRPMPMGTPTAVAMTPGRGRPPLGTGGTPVGKGAQRYNRVLLCIHGHSYG